MGIPMNHKRFKKNIRRISSTNKSACYNTTEYEIVIGTGQNKYQLVWEQICRMTESHRPF